MLMLMLSKMVSIEFQMMSHPDVTCCRVTIKSYVTFNKIMLIMIITMKLVDIITK